MKYANKISEIINAFSPAPLQKEQMAEFYCNTAQVISIILPLRISMIFAAARKKAAHVCCWDIGDAERVRN